MRKINEIFYSLQGEGYHTGTPALFIRFSGCNLKCSFCDTSHEEGVLMTDEEILQKVRQSPARLVVLTGGEPSLWIDRAFVDTLHNCGKYVCIETNGTHLLPDNIDWITCSPKREGKVVLREADEVKVVYEGQEMGGYRNIRARHYFIQPCSNSNIDEAVQYILKNPLWRLSLQTHKLIHIP